MLQMRWIFSFVQQYHWTLEACLEMIQTSRTNIIMHYVRYWTARIYKTILLFVKIISHFFFFYLEYPVWGLESWERYYEK